MATEHWSDGVILYHDKNDTNITLSPSQKIYFCVESWWQSDTKKQPKLRHTTPSITMGLLSTWRLSAGSLRKLNSEQAVTQSKNQDVWEIR